MTKVALVVSDVTVNGYSGVVGTLVSARTGRPMIRGLGKVQTCIHGASPDARATMLAAAGRLAMAMGYELVEAAS